MSKRLLLQLKRPLSTSYLKSEAASTLQSSFFKSKASQSSDYDITEFCRSLDVKKRQVFEHELRRLRREGDETISMHAKKIVAVKPSMTQCRICFIHNAVPFIGFGFLDNAVMIIAGDYIDSTLGVAFHISVLAAAGLGNTMSDVVGIFFGGYVELLADRMGLPQERSKESE